MLKTKTTNELIRQRRKKRAIKQSIILTLLLISIVVTLCLKLAYFNVSEVQVKNNSIIGTDEILAQAKVDIGKNIFYMNLKKVQTNVESNPYILKAQIKRILPNKISISVVEREAVFYGKGSNKIYVIDKQGIVLEERDSIENMNLTELKGFDFDSSQLGKTLVTEDQRKIQLISEITELIELNSSGIKITSVDLSSTIDIKIYTGNMCIKLGGSSNLKDKLNLAFNAIVNNNLKDESGYVDVSFDGNPVVFIEKQEDKK